PAELFKWRGLGEPLSGLRGRAPGGGEPFGGRARPLIDAGHFAFADNALTRLAVGLWRFWRECRLFDVCITARGKHDRRLARCPGSNFFSTACQRVDSEIKLRRILARVSTRDRR